MVYSQSKLVRLIFFAAILLTADRVINHGGIFGNLATSTKDWANKLNLLKVLVSVASRQEQI